MQQLGKQFFVSKTFDTYSRTAAVAFLWLNLLVMYLTIWGIFCQAFCLNLNCSSGICRSFSVSFSFFKIMASANFFMFGGRLIGIVSGKEAFFSFMF